jgi:putative SOS response-associated peptidase YedK
VIALLLEQTVAAAARQLGARPDRPAPLDGLDPLDQRRRPPKAATGTAGAAAGARSALRGRGRGGGPRLEGMCGRYVAVHSPQQLAEEFGVERVVVEGPVEPDYNVAPTKPVLGVLARAGRGEEQAAGAAERQLRELRWGLVPSWAKDPSIGNRLINARVETAAEKPSFRQAFAKRRCILPALGYYEWAQPTQQERGKKTPKQPYFIHRPDDSTLAMAGLYELWRDPHRDRDDPQAWLWTCTVLTTQATDEAGRIHDRAPLTVPPDAYDAWLAPEPGDADHLRELLVPATVGMQVDPVGTAVNNVRNNGPALLTPIADDAEGVDDAGGAGGEGDADGPRELR